MLKVKKSAHAECFFYSCILHFIPVCTPTNGQANAVSGSWPSCCGECIALTVTGRENHIKVAYLCDNVYLWMKLNALNEWVYFNQFILRKCLCHRIINCYNMQCRIRFNEIQEGLFWLDSGLLLSIFLSNLSQISCREFYKMHLEGFREGYSHISTKNIFSNSWTFLVYLSFFSKIIIVIIFFFTNYYISVHSSG